MKKTILFAFAWCMVVAAPVGAATVEERIRALEDAYEEQNRVVREQRELIERLLREREEKAPDAASSPTATESTVVADAEGNAPTGLFGTVMSNPYLSLVLDTFYYASDVEKENLETRGIPGYTAEGFEQRKGFNLRAAELFVFAPVDHYFNLFANLPVTEDGITVEEAYAVTTSLPAGFQVKGGRFKSGFSRLNAQHPHAWDFADISLPYRAFFGPEGTGGDNGVQITWLPPLPFYTLLGGELLQGDGENMLFGRDARSGPHAVTFFAKSSLDIGDNATFYAGPWASFGKTKTDAHRDGTEIRGSSRLYGFEAVWKWEPGARQRVTLQSEYLYLNQKGNLEVTDVDDPAFGTMDSLLRRQDGFYVQGLYRYDRWRIGARYDQLGLFSDTYRRADADTDMGSTPWRLTGALEYNPTEFSRIRLQYTHDRSGGDGRDNNELFVQFIFGIGAHAAHPF